MATELVPSEGIYLDYNASTPLDPRVVAAMQPFLTSHFGNPSNIHSFGVTAKRAVERARSQIAQLLNCQPKEITFTSGGTEAINYGLKGVALAQRRNDGSLVKNHIITSSVEHPAVAETLKYLVDRFGFRLTTVPVDAYGIIDRDEFQKSICDDTFLISVMHANNEVGSINPIAELVKLAKDRNPNVVFHTDASQSVGKVSVDVQELGVDLVNIAGHKLYAPKGVGALYIREGITVEKFMHGASHESGKRAGTENVIFDVALGEASEVARLELEHSQKHTYTMATRLRDGLSKHFSDIRINGHPTETLPNTLSLSFPGLQASTLLFNLREAVAASAGSACHAGSVSISPVLRAMAVDPAVAIGTVRFSTGKYTTEEEIDKAIGLIAEEVRRLKTEAPSVSK